jgi:hypothetical protein
MLSEVIVGCAQKGSIPVDESGLYAGGWLETVTVVRDLKSIETGAGESVNSDQGSGVIESVKQGSMLVGWDDYCA